MYVIWDNEIAHEELSPINYYMAASMSRQDEANPVSCWLLEQTK